MSANIKATPPPRGIADDVLIYHTGLNNRPRVRLPQPACKSPVVESKVSWPCSQRFGGRQRVATGMSYLSRRDARMLQLPSSSSRETSCMVIQQTRSSLLEGHTPLGQTPLCKRCESVILLHSTQTRGVSKPRGIRSGISYAPHAC